MRKRCVEDYSGDLHLDLRKKRSTASLPGVWAERLPPEGPVLPPTSPHASRTHLTPQPAEDRQSGAHPCRSVHGWHHWLGLWESAQAQTCQGHCHPISRVGESPPTPSFSFPGVILHFTVRCPRGRWSEGTSANIQRRCYQLHLLVLAPTVPLLTLLLDTVPSAALLLAKMAQPPSILPLASGGRSRQALRWVRGWGESCYPLLSHREGAQTSRTSASSSSSRASAPSLARFPTGDEHRGLKINLSFSSRDAKRRVEIKGWDSHILPR